MKEEKPIEPRDLRDYASVTNKRLVIGALILLFVVGGGLIAVFYGVPGAMTGLLCMLGGLAVVGIILLFFFVIKKITEKNRDK